MEFTFHKDFSELGPKEWNNLLAESISDVPFLRYEYLSTWWMTRGGGEWEGPQLALISARENGGLLGIAPLFLAKHKGQKALMLIGSIEISDYLDLIVRGGDLARFLSKLLDFLTSESNLDWTSLDLYNLPDSSPTLAQLKAESDERGWAYSQEIYQPSPYIKLPEDFETYLSGIVKKQRHEIRRKMRRAETGEHKVSWYIVEDEASLSSELDDFLSLMANDQHKQEFLTEAMRTQIRKSAQEAFEAGWLLLAFIVIDGQKAAGYLNFDYGNRIWLYNSGLNFNYKDLSPGWVLLAYLLRWAIENGRTEFDFMRGDEPHKYRFGAVDRNVMRVRVER